LVKSLGIGSKLWTNDYIKNTTFMPSTVSDVYKPSYSSGRNQENLGSKPARAKS
jgi:hypothetical protein